jgi:hypothetical protein
MDNVFRRVRLFLLLLHFTLGEFGMPSFYPEARLGIFEIVVVAIFF